MTQADGWILGDNGELEFGLGKGKGGSEETPDYTFSYRYMALTY